MNLTELDERYDRSAVEPVIAYVNDATGIEWLSIGEDLGNGVRYISNIKMRTWTGLLGGVYALLYIAEIARARGIGDRFELRTAHQARTALGRWLNEAGPLEQRQSVSDKADEVRQLGETEGHPSESR